MAGKEKRYTIEKEAPFAKSKIWDIQREYYADSGVSAWNTKGHLVPHYVSNNPSVANAYAEIALGFFRDRHLHQPDNQDTIYLLEVGGGSGRFAFHFIKQFSELHQQTGGDLPPFCYVVSDLSPHNVTYWKEHPRFKPYVEKGQIDFAQFDATSNAPIQLEISGKSLSVGSLSQPLILIANYFFDSIEHEFLYFKNGRVYELLATTTSGVHPKRADISELIASVDIKYTYKRLKPPLYDMPELNALIETYLADIQDSHIYIPTMSIRCLAYLQSLSQVGAMLLTADKSIHTIDRLQGRGIFKLVTHGGSFSLTVNYHAIGHYVEQIGGECLFPAHQYFGLNHSVFLLVDQPEKYVETHFAKTRFIDRYGPDDFFSVKKHIDQSMQVMSIEQIIAYLHLSHYDASLFLNMAEHLYSLLEDVDATLRQTLRDAVLKVWDRYYYIGEQEDVAFEVGMILYELEFFAEALGFFQQSIKTHDVDVATLFNMAVCALQIGDVQQSTQLINRILSDTPDYTPALELRERLQTAIDELSSS